MMPQQMPRLTGIRLADGMQLVAPTDQWIVYIFDVLEDAQKDLIVQRVMAEAKAYQDANPLIAIPPGYEREE